MRVFLSEHLTCGAVHQAEANPLYPEGAAMLRALATDAVRVEGVQVVVMWAKGLPPFGVEGVEVVEVPSVRQEPWFFGELFGEAERTLHIAPDVELWIRASQYADHPADGQDGPVWLGCEPGAVGVAADKRTLDQSLPRAIRRPTRHEVIGGSILGRLPCVMKAKSGAGGGAFLFCTNEDLKTGFEAVLEEVGPDWSVDPIVQEDYIPGRPCSVAAINHEPLPAGGQDIRIDGSPGRLSYHGGAVPAADVDQAAVRRLVAQVYDAVPGLRGWWGIDFVIPDEPFEGSFDPVLIEVNPRLTTSYLGYRALTPDNLAERILFPERAFPPLRWNPGSVSFNKAGDLTVSS